MLKQAAPMEQHWHDNGTATESLKPMLTKNPVFAKQSADSACRKQAVSICFC